MSTASFSEVIKVQDGHFHNLPLHQARMNRTAGHFFGTAVSLPDLQEQLPDDLRTGLVKCRLVYSDALLSVEFARYTYRPLTRIGLVHADGLDYSFKSTDRSQLDSLRQQSGCDEILIIRNGLVTDTSYSNVVFSNGRNLHTPDSYLLAGTQRQWLLQTGEIEAQRITVEDIPRYRMMYLINAMMGIEQRIGIATGDICSDEVLGG